MLVSIVMPAYNAEEFLSDAIESVKLQTYSNWQLIIIDDCSTDGTREIIKAAVNKDPRISAVYLQENAGVAHARNAGIKLSNNADLLAFLDADDLWVPEKLSKQIDLAYFIEQAPLLYTGYEFVNSNAVKSGVVVRVPYRMSILEAYGNHLVWTSTVLINLRLVPIEDIFMIDIGFGEDITTWWRIMSKHGDAYGIDEPLAMYRRSRGSLSANKLVILHRKWRVFKYADDLSIPKKGYYYTKSLYKAVRKRV